MDLQDALPREFVEALDLVLGHAAAEALLHPVYAPDGIAQIQRPEHPHSQAVARLLRVLMPGHSEPLCVGRPCDVATSVNVVATYEGKVALGQKVPQDRFFVGKFCLSPAGWFDDTKDLELVQAILREGEEELGITLDVARLRILGSFLSSKHGDTREADYPSNHTGYVYPLVDDEWQAMLAIDATAPSCEVGHFRLFDERAFEERVAAGDVAFADQIWFVRRYFAFRAQSKLDLLEPIAHG